MTGNYSIRMMDPFGFGLQGLNIGTGFRFRNPVGYDGRLIGHFSNPLFLLLRRGSHSCRVHAQANRQSLAKVSRI